MKKEIERLYSIFSKVAFDETGRMTLTEEGAEKLLDKINEIIDRLNELSLQAINKEKCGTD